MSTLAWFFMLGSIFSVISLVGFCLYKVLTIPSSDAEEQLHGQPAIDTGDTVDAD